MSNEVAMRAFRKKLEECFLGFDDAGEQIVSRMADVGLTMTKLKTPVGDYTRDLFTDTANKRIKYASFATKSGKQVTFRVKHHKQGGTLRRGWKKDKSRKVGRAYISGYSNNVEYAVYVNNGHRIVGEKGIAVGYVTGKRMMEQGITEARQHLPSIMRDELARLKRKSGF